MTPEYALETFTKSVGKILTSKTQLEAVTYLAKTILEFADPRNDVNHPSCSSGLLITDGKVFLAELPTGNKKGKPHQYDLPKGHVENDGFPQAGSVPQGKQPDALSDKPERTSPADIIFMQVILPRPEEECRYARGLFL